MTAPAGGVVPLVGWPHVAVAVEEGVAVEVGVVEVVFVLVDGPVKL
jgi:hypothetical protein